MKKLVAGILCLVMLLQTTVLVSAKEYAQKFWDVPKDHWAFEYIAELVDRGVISGYEDGTFKPEATVSRAEWAKMMVQAAGVKTEDDKIYYNDMQGHWAVKYVNAAKDYLTAFADGSYRPDQAATREDVTMAMVKLKGYDLNEVDYSCIMSFKDLDSISNIMKPYVALAVQKGLISGYEDSTFRGQGTLTRAEAATLLQRAFSLGNDNKTTSTSTTEYVPATQSATDTANNKVDEQSNNDNSVSNETTTEGENKKLYVVDTIVKADVKEKDYYGSYSYFSAYDGEDTLYYVENNHIYSADINTKEVTDLLDLSSLDNNEDIMNPVEFSVDGICYDKYNEQLLVFESFSYALVQESYNCNLYALKNGNIKLIATEWDKPVFGILNTTSDNGYIVSLSSEGNRLALCDSKQNSICTLDNAQDAEEYNSNIYTISDSRLLKYNYINDETIWKPSNPIFAVGLSENKFAVSDGSNIYIGDLDSEKLSIKISTDDCNILDKKPLNFNNTQHKIFITSNSDIVFYDKTAKAFRILYKN